MNTAIPTLPTRTPLKTAATMLLVLGLSGTALAIDQPPEEPEQQRAWLVGHFVTDMQTLGTFRSDEVAEIVGLVNALTDDQTNLLARFYYLTRTKAGEDARLYAMQQTDTEEALAGVQAEVADLLARLRRQIRQTYWELATTNLGCQTLCEIAYASIPGWCEYHDYAIPEWYYGDGCYLGPVLSARYAGAYAIPVYRAFHDRSSRHDWRNGGKHFHDNIVSNPKGDHGGRSSYATTAKRHQHPKAKHGTTLPAASHGSPAVAAKHGKHPKASHGGTPSAKHNGSSAKANHCPSKAARHGNPQSKPSPHSQSQSHRQRPKQGSPNATKPAAHAQSHPKHFAPDNTHPQSGHARQK